MIYDNSANEPPFDARAMMLSLEHALASKSDKPSDQAQKLFYQAMEVGSETEQFKLLKKALELDPGNIDTLLYLLPHVPSALEEEIAALRKIVDLAATRLGPKAFKEMAGGFWGFHETRPYMRARYRLAETLRVAGRLDEAIAEFAGLLELNPNDNQAVRYALLPCLLIERRLEAARELLEKYPEEAEWNVVFAWGLILERFLSADIAGAEKALASAQKMNPHMQAYVKGHRRLPQSTPNSYAPGSKDEAICFAEQLHGMWARFPAALKWLEAQKAR